MAQFVPYEFEMRPGIGANRLSPANINMLIGKRLKIAKASNTAEKHRKEPEKPPERNPK